MNKKRRLIICELGVLIILNLFALIYYKTQKNVNNINKSTNEIARYILNISSYEANLEVTIKSNKTINQYKIKQWYSSPNIIKQIIESPQNLNNLTMTYDGKNMKVENTNLSLSKIYQDYKYISENTLWLSTFIDNYNDKSKIYEKEGKVIIESNVAYNFYNVKEVLYIDKKTGKPIELKIFDNSNNNRIYIKYNEIKINQTKQNEIVAFKIKEHKKEI